MKRSWKALSFPENLYDKIDAILKKNSTEMEMLRIHTVSDFIQEASIRLLKEMETSK